MIVFVSYFLWLFMIFFAHLLEWIYISVLVFSILLTLFGYFTFLWILLVGCLHEVQLWGLVKFGDDYDVGVTDMILSWIKDQGGTSCWSPWYPDGVKFMVKLNSTNPLGTEVQMWVSLNFTKWLRAIVKISNPSYLLGHWNCKFLVLQRPLGHQE